LPVTRGGPLAALVLAFYDSIASAQAWPAPEPFTFAQSLDVAQANGHMIPGIGAWNLAPVEAVDTRTETGSPIARGSADRSRFASGTHNDRRPHPPWRVPVAH
jgi:hypothetical protein